MIANHPLSEEDHQAQVEDYLDHVLAPLVGTVPYHRRKELRSELNAHLETMVEARMELGETHGQAVSAALRQFGNPAAIGSDWLGEWRPKSGFPLRTMKLAAAYFLPASCVGWLIASIAGPAQAPTGMALLVVLMVIPIFTGFLVGLLARNRPGAGTLLGILGLALVTGLIGAVEAFGIVGVDQPVVMPLAVLAAIEAYVWAPLGSLAALAGGAVRKRLLDTIRSVGSI